MAGPVMRTDIVDVYVFRTQPRLQFLQLHRAEGALSGTWHPVMGHVLEHETAPQTALRELAEETGYAPGNALDGLWQLEQPNIYYLTSHESMVLSPCFAARVNPNVEPRLNEEHDDHRWVDRDDADRLFLWPGQRLALQQIQRDLIPPDSPHLKMLRIDVEAT